MAACRSPSSFLRRQESRGQDMMEVKASRPFRPRRKGRERQRAGYARGRVGALNVVGFGVGQCRNSEGTDPPGHMPACLLRSPAPRTQ